MSIKLSIGNLVVEFDGESVGLVVGRTDPANGEQIRIHAGSTAAYNGLCGRFTCAGRLIYYCRMTAAEFEMTRAAYKLRGATHFFLFTGEEDLAADVVVRTISAVRRPTLEELSFAVESLVLQPTQDWSVFLYFNTAGELERFQLCRRYYQEVPGSEYPIEGIDGWDLANAAAPGDIWRVPYPVEWSPPRCNSRYAAEEDIVNALEPLIERLRGNTEDVYAQQKPRRRSRQPHVAHR